jgi:pimeloyl-ACP methyl ester carboxylesterase
MLIIELTRMIAAGILPRTASAPSRKQDTEMSAKPDAPSGRPLPSSTAPTLTVTVDGADIAWRELGAAQPGTPTLVALTHLGANLDSWDPELVDALAADRHVVLLGYQGVGRSGGRVRDSIDETAADVVAAVRALGLDHIDLLGLSMGGMVAQSVLEQAPDLVDRVVLASSAPRGGTGLTAMPGVMARGIARGVLTRTEPTFLLFFTRTSVGKEAAAAYQERLRRRRSDRDPAAGLSTVRAQLRAVTAWGRGGSGGRRPPLAARALVLHGNSDRMVPVSNAEHVASRFRNAEIPVFPDAGHGVVSQERVTVAELIRQFLRR